MPERTGTEKSRKYYFYGKRNEVISDVNNFLVLKQVIAEVDVGHLVGGNEWEARMVSRFQPLTIDFHLNKNEKSPFANRGSGSRVTIQVPFIDKAKITYEKVREALAPASWGEHGCEITFESPGGHIAFIKTSGSSENDAIQLARNLYALCETGCILKAIKPKELVAEGIYAAGHPMHRTHHKLHPHRMFISNQDLLEHERRQGKKGGKPAEIPLWYEKCPAYVVQDIINALKKGDDEAK